MIVLHIYEHYTLSAIAIIPILSAVMHMIYTYGLFYDMHVDCTLTPSSVISASASSDTI